MTPGRILLSHNFDISPETVPALDREEFAEVFRIGLMAYPSCQCRMLSHPHWMVEILFPIADYSPQQLGEFCAQAMVNKRQLQRAEVKAPLTILVLGGLKSTPPTSTSPDALQPGNWGVDVVETHSGENFLHGIGWEATIVQRPAKSVFKVERSLLNT